MGYTDSVTSGKIEKIKLVVFYGESVTFFKADVNLSLIRTQLHQ